MNDNELTKLAKLRTAARLQEVMPDIEHEVEAMSKSVTSRVFTAIRQNKLTPDIAVNAWLELYANNRLLQRFNDTVTMADTTKE